MLAELDNYDWAQIFADENWGNVTKEIEAHGCSDAPFTREDVSRIIAMDNDGSEEPIFAGLFQLQDGRYLAATGWHDYTGWD